MATTAAAPQQWRPSQQWQKAGRQSHRAGLLEQKLGALPVEDVFGRFGVFSICLSMFDSLEVFACFWMALAGLGPWICLWKRPEETNISGDGHREASSGVQLASRIIVTSPTGQTVHKHK